MAKELTDKALPLLAREAKMIGFVDDVIAGKLLCLAAIAKLQTPEFLGSFNPHPSYCAFTFTVDAIQRGSMSDRIDMEFHAIGKAACKGYKFSIGNLKGFRSCKVKNNFYNDLFRSDL